MHDKNEGDDGPATRLQQLEKGLLGKVEEIADLKKQRKAMVKKIEDIDNLIEWKQDNLGTIKQQLRRLHEMDPPMDDGAQSVQ
eukprot:9139061-Prorocentrum_lima.AAC.1